MKKTFSCSRKSRSGNVVTTTGYTFKGGNQKRVTINKPTGKLYSKVTTQVRPYGASVPILANINGSPVKTRTTSKGNTVVEYKRKGRTLTVVQSKPYDTDYGKRVRTSVISSANLERRKQIRRRG
jgi:hypothetical protein